MFLWHMPPETSAGESSAPHDREHRASADYSHISNLFGQKEISQLFKSAETCFERFVVFYTVVRMNRRSITLRSSQELSPIPPNWGKRRNCVRQAALHRRARLLPPRPTSGRPRGHHPLSLMHNHVWVHMHAGGRHSGGKMGAYRSCLKNFHSSV